MDILVLGIGQSMRGDDAAGLLRCPYLKFDPVADISDRGLQPRFHVRDLQECQAMTAIVGRIEYSAKNLLDATGQNKTGATFFGLRRLTPK